MSNLRRKLRRRMGVKALPEDDFPTIKEPVVVDGGGSEGTAPETVTDTGSVVEGPGFNIGSKIPNIGLPPSQITGRVNVQNALRLRVQMGNEYGKNTGWYSVVFPQKMINPHVVATSGPRSAEVPAISIRLSRRADYITAFGKNLATLVLKPIRDIIPDNPIEDWLFDDVLNPLLSEFGGLIGGLVYDTVVKPTLQITEMIIKDTIPILPDAWGLERGRSVHSVDIKEITETGFKWYSYGEQYINWIAIGLSEESYVPPEISQPLGKVQEEIGRIREEFENYKQQLVSEVQDVINQLKSEVKLMRFERNVR